MPPLNMLDRGASDRMSGGYLNCHVASRAFEGAKVMGKVHCCYSQSSGDFSVARRFQRVEACDVVQEDIDLGLCGRRIQDWIGES